MSFFGAIKRKARLSLKGNWGGGISVYALVTVIICALQILEFALLRSAAAEPAADLVTLLWHLFADESFFALLVTAGFTLLSLLLVSPLQLGVQRYFYLAAHQEAPRFRDLFHFFGGIRRYGKALWYTVQLYLRCLLWGLLFFAFPSGIMAVSVRFLSLEALSRESRAAASVGVVLACVLFALAALLFAIFVQRYALGSYLICRDDTRSVRQIFKSSIRMTKGNRGMLLLFSLSYLGWYLLSPFTFFLLLICYALPYRAAGGMILSRYLFERYGLEQEEPRAIHAKS